MDLGRLASNRMQTGQLLARQEAAPSLLPAMEALVILLVPLVALIVWAAAYFQPNPFNSVAERAQLEQHIAWLEDRLAHARQHNWDEQMIGNLIGQLETARRQQAG